MTAGSSVSSTTDLAGVGQGCLQGDGPAVFEVRDGGKVACTENPGVGPGARKAGASNIREVPELKMLQLLSLNKNPHADGILSVFGEGLPCSQNFVQLGISAAAP